MESWGIIMNQSAIILMLSLYFQLESAQKVLNLSLNFPYYVEKKTTFYN